VTALLAVQEDCLSGKNYFYILQSHCRLSNPRHGDHASIRLAGNRPAKAVPEHRKTGYYGCQG